jgi:hypothetical protein
LSSHVRAPELAYLADLQSDDEDDDEEDNNNNINNHSNNSEDDENEGADKDGEEMGIDSDENFDSLFATTKKRSSGRTSKKPSRLIEPASKQAFTGSLERLKQISNSKRKPSVAVKMYVPSFDIKPKVPTKMFGSRHRSHHARKDEESVTIHTLYCKYFIEIRILHSLINNHNHNIYSMF